MSNIDLPEADASARMELRALLAYVWEGRNIILATIGIFLLLGLAWYRFAPRIYEASELLSAAPGSSISSGGGGTNSAFSGAARLIGLGGAAGNSSAAEYTKFQALLTSSLLAQRLAAKPGFLQQMYPGNWDEKTRSWKQPSGLLTLAKSGIRTILGMPPRQSPDAQAILNYLRNDLNQDLSLQTALLQLTVTSPNPEFAKMFLTTVHREADDILRDAARTRSQRRIAYLQETLQTVNAVEQRQALIDLLNQEEQTNMMIESDPNYAADLIDPPHVSPNPISPLFSAMVIVSLVGGFLFGILLYVLLRTFDLHNRLKVEWNPGHWFEAFSPRRR